MPTVTALLRTDKINKHGTAPIYLRFADRSRTVYTSIGIRVKPKDWNEAKGQVRKSDDEHEAKNDLIKARLAEASGATVRFLRAGQEATAQDIRAVVVPEAKHSDFFAYAEAVAQDFEARSAVGRARKLRTMASRLKEVTTAPLPFDRITPALLKAYETDLLVRVGNHPNTVRSLLTALRSVLYRAIREGHADQDKNPFFKFSLMKEQRSQRSKLTAEDLRKIETLDLPVSGTLWRARAYFLFAFYGAGIRFGDLARLRWEHVAAEPDGGLRLSYRMSKTSGLKSVRLLPQARAILEAFPKRPSSEYLFPILDRYDTSTAKGMLSAISTQTVLANKALKKIAELAKVKGAVTTHVARHSFADIARTRGWDVYSISKALGHASLKVTENYLCGFDTSALDDKMQDLFG